MGRTNIKILIADDHAVVRRGIRQILHDESDMKLVAEATNAEEVLDVLRTKSCDVVLLDISMPGKSGIEVLKDLKAEHPRLHVLLLSMHPEGQFAVRALRSGAAGYLTKETAPEELVRAIRKVYSGGKYVSASLAEKLAEDLDVPSLKSPHEVLSDREFEVLRQLASGKSASQIAHALSLSVKTISTYRARLLSKLKLKTTAQLMHYAIKNKLVE